jgi:hypothetical protein
MARLARFVAAMVVAWGPVLAPPGMAQPARDPDALNSQVIKLYGEGEYARAIPLARNHFLITL